MIDLSIIIVSYNTKEFLEKCLQSINENLGDLKIEIIIVDNASKDNSVTELSKLKTQNSLRPELRARAKLKVIENKKNLGFSKANNIGIRQSSGRYVLFLNPDTIIYKDMLGKMVEFMDDNKDTGAATCRVELPNGKLDDACHRGFPTPWRAFCYFSGLSKIFPHSKLFSGYNLGFMDLSITHEIDACAGAFMMVRREAGKEIGWWDEDYFWYGEDLDFCYKLKEKGLKVYFVPTVSTLHYKGVSGGIKEISNHLTTASKETKISATYARFEAMRIFYKKHYISKYPRFITWLVLQTISLKLKSALKNL